MARQRLRWDLIPKDDNNIVRVADIGLTLRPCVRGIDKQGNVVRTLYCARNGQFFVPERGWHQQHPNYTPNKPSLKDRRSHSAYPIMRNFGGKLCHHLIAVSWHGPRPKGCECDHLNGNILDCRVSNLQWVTPAENMRRAGLMRCMRKIGLAPLWLYPGILRGLYSLPTEQAKLIIERFRFEAGTNDDALTIERINSTFAFLLDELKSQQL